jgi:hypothetical protein
MSDEPAGAVGHNLKFVSRSDQSGRGDGVQINVVDGYAYAGHMFTGGISVIDVRDPRDPKYVRFIPAPPNSWFIHLQAHESVFLEPWIGVSPHSQPAPSELVVVTTSRLTLRGMPPSYYLTYGRYVRLWVGG